MEVEFPLLIYSHEFSAHISLKVRDIATCINFYKTDFGLKDNQAKALCSDYILTRFNFFRDPLESSKIWTSLILFNSTNNMEYMEQFLFALNITSEQAREIITSPKI